MKFTPALMLLAAVLVAAPAWADSEIVLEVRSLTGESPASRSTIQLSSDSLRARQVDQSTDEIIFRSDRDLVWLISTSKKEYVAMTPQDLEALGQVMSAAMKQAEAAMAAMPPEQQEMMKKMMGGQLPPGMGEPAKVSGPKPVWKKVASDVKVGDWTCDHYQSVAGTEIVRELWAAPLSSVQVDPASWNVMQKLGDFFKVLAEKIPMNPNQKQLDPSTWDVPPEIKTTSFPVKVVEYHDGKPAIETTFVEIKKTTFPAGTFDLPEGLTEKKLIPALPES